MFKNNSAKIKARVRFPPRSGRLRPRGVVGRIKINSVQFFILYKNGDIMAENKFTATDLKMMQSLPLEDKIEKTKMRIREYYDWFGGDVYVSFSGGKDSTVLLDLVRQEYPEVPAIFVDTGLEYPEVKDFVKSHDNVTIVRPTKTFRQVIELFGYPIVSKKVAGYVATAKRNPDSARAKFLSGEYDSKIFGFGDGKWNFLVQAPFKISDYCCDVMKKQPGHHYQKETGRHPIIGTLAEESIMRRNEWMRSGCNAFDGKEPISKPLSFWTEQDILKYLKERNVPYCPLYGDIVTDKKGKLSTTGINRTGCIFCGFGCHREKCPNRFQQLKVSHPKIWEYCMKPWDEGGLGLKEVLEYINVPIE